MAEQGQCGHDPNGATGETPNVTTPEKIIMPHEQDGVLLRYIQIACGAYHTLVVDEDQNVRSFGSGNRGRLGEYILKNLKEEMREYDICVYIEESTCRFFNFLFLFPLNLVFIVICSCYLFLF